MVISGRRRSEMQYCPDGRYCVTCNQLLRIRLTRRIARERDNTTTHKMNSRENYFTKLGTINSMLRTSNESLDLKCKFY